MKRSELTGQKETRIFDMTEIRVSEGEKPKIRGYAALFDKWSVQLYGKYGFKEKVSSGAFAETIAADDIRGAFNHDPNKILGRNTAGTMVITEDSKGLAYEIDPPDTQYARDLMVSINRGDISGCSFMFEVLDDEWNKDETERIIKKVRLYELGPVTFPAYPQTSVKVRSAFAAAGLDYDALAGVLMRSESQAPLTESDQALIKDAIKVLDRCLPAVEPVPPGAREDGYQAQLETLGRRLALASIG